MPETYTYPDGDTVEIPEGAEIVREGDRILYWREPAITPPGELHPTHVPGYQPRFGRDSATRRVLMHVTDEEHVGRGPRNTTERLAHELWEDPCSPAFPRLDPDLVQRHLDALVKAELVEHRSDGTYALTAAGLTELHN